MMWYTSRASAGPAWRSRRSSTMVLFAICFVAMCGMVGLGVDVALCYLSRAKLFAASDAAELVALRNAGKPDAEIRRLAIQAFERNCPDGELDPEDIVITRTPGARIDVDIHSEVVQPLTFIRVLGIHGNATRADGTEGVRVQADTSAVRFPILMAVIIDRSGSMTGNGGSTTIPATIPQFLDNFVEGFDTVGIFSYSWAAVRELGFTTNFNGIAMQNLFNGSANRVQFGGYTSPSDCLRLALEDIQLQPGYVLPGVKKIVVFMTDGLFNTFRTRPPNTLGAFTNPPPGKTAAWWSDNWFHTNSLYSSIAQWGNNGNGISPTNSTSPPSDDFPALGGGFTYVATNATGSGVFFKNLDAQINENLEVRFPFTGATQSYVYGSPAARYTNIYTVGAKGTSDSGYPEGKTLTDTSIRTVFPTYRYSNTSLPSGGRAIDRFKANHRFLSCIDGNMKSLNGTNVRAEAREHCIRYCDAARKKTTSPSQVTVFCIGFGSSSQLDVDVLMKMANLNPSDTSIPYTRLDNTEPADVYFGFTRASDAAALQRTYIALGIYLAQRLTK